MSESILCDTLYIGSLELSKRINKSHKKILDEIFCLINSNLTVENKSHYFEEQNFINERGYLIKGYLVKKKGLELYFKETVGM